MEIEYGGRYPSPDLTKASKPFWIKWLRIGLTCIVVLFLTACSAFYIAAFGPPRFSPVTQTLQINAPICGIWDAVAWPKIDSFLALVSGPTSVSALSNNDIWIAGSKDGNSDTEKTLIRHWDGKRWLDVATPKLGPNDNWLSSIAALSNDDVWAVGKDNDHALIMHWDGNQWKVVPSPKIGQGHNGLRTIEAVSKYDIWAAGWYEVGKVSQPLILHWDGKEWVVVPGPNTGNDTSINSIEALSKTDIWFVGYSENDGLTMHWNGKDWNVIYGPRHGDAPIDLYDVSAASSSDVWAVGAFWRPGTTEQATIHWDGEHWTEVPVPREGHSSMGNLQDVEALAPNDTWAVGQDFGEDSNRRSLVYHWDGTQWSFVPNAKTMSEQGFMGLAAISPNEIIAVGNSDDTEDGAYYALVSRFTRTVCTKQP